MNLSALCGTGGLSALPRHNSPTGPIKRWISPKSVVRHVPPDIGFRYQGHSRTNLKGTSMDRGALQVSPNSCGDCALGGLIESEAHATLQKAAIGAHSIGENQEHDSCED